MINTILQATNYIQNELESFIKDFAQTRVRYEFDINANVHCVEIVPNQVYRLNKDYISWENNISDGFISFFPDQNLCFFSDDAIVGINNIQFELTGKLFNEFVLPDFIGSVIPAGLVEVNSKNCDFSFDNISTSIAVFSNSVYNKIKLSNDSIESVNSLSCFENQNQAFFTHNFPLAA